MRNNNTCKAKRKGNHQLPEDSDDDKEEKNEKKRQLVGKKGAINRNLRQNLQANTGKQILKHKPIAKKRKSYERRSKKMVPIANEDDSKEESSVQSNVDQNYKEEEERYDDNNKANDKAIYKVHSHTKDDNEEEKDEEENKSLKHLDVQRYNYRINEENEEEENEESQKEESGEDKDMFNQHRRNDMYDIDRNQATLTVKIKN